MTEEGRPCRPRLIYLPNPTMSGPARRSVHWLAEPIPLERRGLRKLAAAHGPLGYLVWRVGANGSPELTGIHAREGGDPPDLIISAAGWGAVDATYCAHRLATFRAGEIRRFSTCKLPGSLAAFKSIADMFERVEPHLLVAIVRAILDDGHGGAVWILREGASVSPGTRVGFGTVDDGSPLLERFPKHEARAPWLVSIARLAAIDGAVLLDSQLRVRGFGTFIDLVRLT